MGKRTDSLDCLHALMLLFMISLHAGWDFQYWNKYFDYLYHILYFYMPWFFYKSGMFFRVKGIKDYAIRLLVPFVVFSLLGIIIHLLTRLFYDGHLTLDIKGLISNFAYVGNFQENGPLWFLFSLFIIQLVVSVCIRLFNDSAILYLVLFSSVLSIVFFHYHIEFPRYMVNSCSGLFFFCFGMLFRDKQYNKWFASFCIIIFVFIVCIVPSHVDMAVNNLGSGFYEIWMISAVCGSVAFNFVFKFVEVNSKLLKCVSFLGRNAIVLYVIHSPLLYLLKNYISFSDNHKLSFFTSMAIIISVSYPLSYFINNSKFKWMIGK